MNITVHLEERTWSGGKSSFTLWWIDHTGKRQRQSVRNYLGRRKFDKVTKREAQQARAKKQGEINRGDVSAVRPRGHVTLASLIETYEYERTDRPNPKTIKAHLASLRKLAEFVGGDTSLPGVTERDANAFRGELQRSGLADESVKHHLRNVKAIWNWALDLRMVEANPFGRMKGLQTRARSTPLPDVSREAIESMMTAAKRKRNGNAWVGLLALCRYAGLRFIEAVELPWVGQMTDDHGQRHWVGVDWERSRICLVGHHKGRKGGRIFREVPMGRRLSSVLAGVYDAADAGTVNVAHGLRNNYNRDLRVIMEWAEVEPFAEPFKAMRAACEKEWAERGIALATYAAWTGHDPSVSVRHYTIPGEREAAAVVDAD